MANFQFLMPKITNLDADDNDIAEECEIKEIESERLFRSETHLNTESDDEYDAKDGKDYIHNNNTTYYSNSTSATSTHTDHMFRAHKKSLIEEVQVGTIVNENVCMEIDSVEWNKEVDRVSRELDDFSQKLDEGDTLLLLKSISLFFPNKNLRCLRCR